METNGRKVPVWLITVLLVSVFTAIIGWVLVSVGKIDNKVEASVVELSNYKASANLLSSQILERLSSIETNLVWVKEALKQKNILNIK